MMLIEAIPEIGKGEVRKPGVEGANSSMMYLLHCKNLCK
jgi:hypothetical protein